MGFASLIATQVCILGALLSLIHPDAWKVLNTRLQPVEPGDAVLVTGASSGIGRHAALSLAKEGFTVYTGVRRTEDGEKLRSLAAELGLEEGLVKPLIVDVTKSDDIQAAMRTISDDVGARGLKGIFSNAGVGFLGPAEYNSRKTYQDMMETNFHGAVELSIVFLELLRAGKGTLVINSSLLGRLGAPYASPYSASKWALEGYADCFRREVAHAGVRVVVLEVGLVKTNIWQKMDGPSREDAKYPNFHRAFVKGTADFAKAPGPRVSSEAIVHAMRAVEPETRYMVGGEISLFLKLLLKLPDKWLDYLLAAITGSVVVPADGGAAQLAALREDTARGFEL